MGGILRKTLRRNSRKSCSGQGCNQMQAKPAVKLFAVIT
jgi:hypothetical protein